MGMLRTGVSIIIQVSNSVLGLAVISAVIGVQQGSGTSCFLFTVFVNYLIRSFKTRCAWDSFLKWLHVLMMMDDTVIFASTREKCLEKLHVLKDFCKSARMVVNEDRPSLWS